ncbi:MAG: hypothetical protein B6241_03880 [Spirochaetaceae bacterium 4572_59]|nr:MAG: hypothetical protein B6241_03880 [Spirochaetaceae bacterium 4572_59]
MKLITEKTQFHQFPEKVIDKLGSIGIPCPLKREENDRRIFFAIQIDRYLKRKIQKRFCSEAEKDVIEDIISDYWEYIKDDLRFDSDDESKNEIYYACIIVFPYFVAEEDNIIPVDFASKSVLHYSHIYMCENNLEGDESEFGSF